MDSVEQHKLYCSYYFFPAYLSFALTSVMSIIFISACLLRIGSYFTNLLNALYLKLRFSPGRGHNCEYNAN